MEWVSIFAIALIITLILMILTWIFAVKIENFGIVDATWSFSFLVHSIIFYFLSEGFFARKVLLLFVIGVWSFRLGYYLTRRISSHHPNEDTRYIKLREVYGRKYKKRFFVFFIYQALSVSLLTLPFIFIFKNQSPIINNWEIAGVSVWLLSLFGESVADYQLNTFKNNPKKIGRTCNVGLWKFSRHPNYFFESNIWWGFFLIMIGSGVYWGVYASLLILFLLLKVTGIPPSEVQALKSRGDEYREYQRKTSAFVPWFPKK